MEAVDAETFVWANPLLTVARGLVESEEFALLHNVSGLDYSPFVVNVSSRGMAYTHVSALRNVRAIFYRPSQIDSFRGEKAFTAIGGNVFGASSSGRTFGIEVSSGYGQNAQRSVRALSSSWKCITCGKS